MSNPLQASNVSASSEFNEEQLPGAPATVDKQDRRSRLRDASPTQYALVATYACGVVSSGGIAIPDCNVPVPNLYRACSALSCGSRPQDAQIYCQQLSECRWNQ